ncbi:MAG: hypothetical protein ACK5QC_03435 [Bacteroidota bacterium]|jgi:hypothetical protein
MNSERIHHVNTGLIILSCVVSFFIPFELFLFSYAVLGPLHYLTEIGWLHKKNYFTKGKNDFLFLVVASVILVWWNFYTPKNYYLLAHLTVLSVLASIVFVFMKDWLYRIVVIILSMIMMKFIKNTDSYFTWIAIFLPTIIHVFIFTWVFMLYGVLKEKSKAGIISVITLFVCAAAIFMIQPQNLFYEVSQYTKTSYKNFSMLNMELVDLFGLQKLETVSEIFTTNAGFVIMRFIAFAYTYHYLNWFSKTSVIKWHQVPRKTLLITLTVWLASVGFYLYDYSLGLNVLFFLSFLHVFLEFPLNVVSFTGIGKEISGLVKSKA